MSDPQTNNIITQICEKVVELHACINARHHQHIHEMHQEYVHLVEKYDALCIQLQETLKGYGITIMPLPSVDRSEITTYIDYIYQPLQRSGKFLSDFRSIISQSFKVSVYDDTIQHYADRIKRIKKDIDTISSIHDDCINSLSDLFFRQSLQQILGNFDYQGHEWPLIHMLCNIYHKQRTDTTQFITHEKVLIPHPAISTWFIHRFHSTHSTVSLLAWGLESLDIHKYAQYHRVLEFITDQVIIREIQIDAEIDTSTWPTISGLARIIQTAPIPSPKIEERRRKRLYGELTLNDFIISYAFVPNEYSQNNGYPSEDVLLFDTHEQDFFVAVCDGVSQSCLGEIAAKNVAQSLYHVWQQLLHDTNQISQLDTLLHRSFQVAIVRCNHDIHHFMENPPNNFSSTTIDILHNLNNTGGSQSIFACAFSFAGKVYTIWMGNTAIIMQGNVQGDVLSYNDERFQDDSIRFSSKAINGLRGDYHIQVFDDFLTANTKWRIVIHSDALEEYPDREETLYTAPLERPHGRPLNADDVKLEQCIRIDDTTIVELFYERQ